MVDRVLKYLEAGAALQPGQRTWKVLQYQLLVARDAPKDLEKRIRQWIDAGDPANPWRVTLGYLLAEQGQFAAAAKQFEPVGEAGELRGPDYRALADWHTVLNQREAHDRAVVASLRTMDEYRLDQWIYRAYLPWQRANSGEVPPPRELDAQVPLAFVAMLEKASYPQNHLWRLQQFYQATRDFRLLAGLTDALVGHTAGQVYPLLQNLGSVLGEVRDEATADAIVERIGVVRARAKTEIDQRALDLLETLVERRAAELQNQPGPHVDRALAALDRAWRRKWSPGEPRLMGELLASLGKISDGRLAAEQVRELEGLYASASPLLPGEGPGVRAVGPKVESSPASPSPQPSPGGRGGYEDRLFIADAYHTDPVTWPLSTLNRRCKSA